ncbi:VWA domain-containing protein [Craurococcus roseus]|uniref:VWA domain-containing protein n=1 Tax=Craurococcus roseus TaxID=77585 RepID=A0ABN1FEB6_9PROT
MTAPLLDFVRAARSAGLRVSPAESIDAARALELVGLADRECLRDTLSLVLAKTTDEKARFDICFDRFFSRGSFADVAPAPPDATAPAEGLQPEGGFGEGMGGGLAAMLRDGDRAGLAAAMEEAAAEAGLSEIAVFTQVNLYTRRILERMGLDALEREIARLGETPQGDALRRRRDWLRGEVRGFAQQNLRLFAEGEAERQRERRLAATRLSAIDPRDRQRMRALVRAMARRLAARYGRKRWRSRRGQLDARRTLRRNMGWGGVPFRPVWKRRRVEKPRLVVLCDVSGSVAAVAEFLLLFLHSLNEALSGLRSFAFSGDLVEVGAILERHPIERAIPEIMDLVGFGSSNYGRSLAAFEAGFARTLDRRTTVIVLGDGRGNRTDPRVDVLQRIAERSKQVIWLNPEPRTVWGTGDSDMLRYAPHCRVAATCATLGQLERIVAGLLRDGA